MSGSRQARQKPLEGVTPIEWESSRSIKSYEKPPEKGPVKLVDAGDIDQLIDLLQNEANAI